MGYVGDVGGFWVKSDGFGDSKWLYVTVLWRYDMILICCFTAIYNELVTGEGINETFLVVEKCKDF